MDSIPVSDRPRPDALPPPTPWLDSIASLLPPPGRALDIGGAIGRNALWFARHGYDTTLVDPSARAVDVASRAAAGESLALTTVVDPLDQPTVPAGPWDVVLMFRYFRRHLFSPVLEALGPGGVVIVSAPTARNLPPGVDRGADILAAEGEVVDLLVGLEVLVRVDGRFDGPHEERVVARADVR